MLLPQLKLTPEEKADIEEILAKNPDMEKTDYPTATGDEIEIDDNGKRIYPWSKFEDHQDDAVKIEYYEREHNACIDHIL